MDILRSTFTLLKTILKMAFLAAFFQRAHQYLPERLKVTSFCFWSLVAMFLAAAVLRHSLVGIEPPSKLLFGLAMYLTLLIFFFASKYPTELALYLATSIGLDIAVATLGVASGVQMNLGNWGLAWEVLATVAAIRRLHSERQLKINQS